MRDVIARLHGPVRPPEVRLPTGWPWLTRRIEAADPSASEWFVLQSVAGAALGAGFAAAVLVHPLVGAATASVGPVITASALLRWRHRRRERLIAALPPALDLLVRLLRTGLSPRQAIGRATAQVPDPLAERLHSVVVALRLGSEADLATARLHGPGDPRELARTAIVLGVALREGAGTADALERLAASMRRDRSVRRQARMLTAQARLSARVLSALPVAFVGLGVLTGNEQIRSLATTTIGRACAVVGATLLAAGFGWMHLLIDRIDRWSS